jgi:hypothetical protein
MSLHSLLGRLRREDGIVLPTTIMVIAVALILVGVAAANVQFSGDSANTDRRAKRAQQAADAGVAAAVNRINRLDLTHGFNNQPGALQCVSVGATGTLSIYALDLSPSKPWCAPVTENLGNGDSYTYSMKPNAQPAGSFTTQWTVVSTGTAGGVRRRVIVDAAAQTGAPLFADEAAVQSLADLNVTNTSQIIGNAESNGDIIFTQSANQPCPSEARAGLGKQVKVDANRTNAICAARNLTKVLELSPKTPPSSFDGNARLCSIECSPTGVVWQPGIRRLLINGGAVTFNSGDYSFCQFETQNQSQIYIAKGATVRIWIDSPENCNYTTKVTSPAPGYDPTKDSIGGITLSNKTTITNLNGSDPRNLQLYVAGSTTPGVCTSFQSGGTLPTPYRCVVSLGNNNTSYLVLHAPNSAVLLNNSVDLHGSLAARQIWLTNSAKVTYDQLVREVPGDDIYPVFKVTGYRECNPTVTAAASSADTGC